MNRRLHTTGRTRPTRRAFTLVELLVAMALSLGIMVILTEAFQKSLDFVAVMNANKDLMNQLSNAGNLLEHDLEAEHFLREDGKPNGGVRLSDQRLDLPTWRAPRGGFFHITAPQPAYEPFTDREGHNLSNATNHALHFTSILKGGGDQELFTTVAPAPGGISYKSRAAEVQWFLVPTGEYTSGTNPMPLHNLVRRYRLVALDDDVRSSLQSAIAADPLHAQVISVPNPNPAPGTVNTLATVANPQNRMPFTAGPLPQGGTRYGEDIVLTNVLSFQVLAWWDGGTPPLNTRASRPYGTTAPVAGTVNTEGPYDFLFQGAGNFDTSGPAASPNAVPQRVRIRSLQITIRIANTRAGIARSNTWKFAM